MKNQSKKMLQYLSDVGVLGGSEEAIQSAKIAYRREYKRHWKKNLKKSKELRPSFTPIEFEQVVLRAKLFGLTPTAYARDIIMSSQGHFDLIPNKDKLLYILQAISMAEIALKKDNNSHDTKALLLQAEEMLSQYLNFK